MTIGTHARARAHTHTPARPRVLVPNYR